MRGAVAKSAVGTIRQLDINNLKVFAIFNEFTT